MVGRPTGHLWQSIEVLSRHMCGGGGWVAACGQAGGRGGTDGLSPLSGARRTWLLSEQLRYQSIDAASAGASHSWLANSWRDAVSMNRATRRVQSYHLAETGLFLGNRGRRISVSDPEFEARSFTFQLKSALTFEAWIFVFLVESWLRASFDWIFKWILINDLTVFLLGILFF